MRPLFNLMLGLTLGAFGGLSAASAAEAGRIVFVAGQVQLAGHAAVLDAAVQEGDELSTGAQGYVYMKTVDSGFLILRPNSRARITTYHVDIDNPANTRVKLELLGGVARSISGQAVKQARQNFRFNTPVAAIGVRGTDFTVFTDQQTSRIAVVSGGVVVSGFAGACGPDGGGPCEGSASRELFAGQAGMLLQVQRGQTAPKLMHNPALSPDQGAPARSDEPVAKAISSPAVLPAPDVSFEAHKNTVLNTPKDNLKPTEVPTASVPVAPVLPITPVVPVVPVTPVVPAEPIAPVGPIVPTLPIEPVTPIVPKLPDVLWGRYDAVAAAPADEVARVKLESGAYTLGSRVGSYQIARLKNSELVLPGEGTASFALTASEATLQKAGQPAVLADVRNAKLDVNFGTRSFTTSMLLVAPDAQMSLTGHGDLHGTGDLVNSQTSSMTIRGALGGARAQEAAYIFESKSVTTPGLIAEGATNWSR